MRSRPPLPIVPFELHPVFIALLALFLRFVRKPRTVFDSLRKNAYGMYVVHYAIVSWIQLSILPLPLTALGKATLAVAANVPQRNGNQ